jgi:predicted HAD superfamily Cof-like phosphohydrolase
MNRMQEKVRQFHKDVCGIEFESAPKMRRPRVRAALLIEEAIETAIALVGVQEAQTLVQAQLLDALQTNAREKRKSPDLIEAIDGVCDVLFIAYGTAEDLGVDIEPHFNEVARSNLAKAGGKLNASGKLEKPAHWTPPEHLRILNAITPVFE